MADEYKIQDINHYADTKEVAIRKAIRALKSELRRPNRKGNYAIISVGISVYKEQEDS